MSTKRTSLFSQLFRRMSKPATLSRRSPRTRPGLTLLEDRLLLATYLTASLDLAEGILRVEGTDDADTVRVFQTGGEVLVEGITIAVTGQDGVVLDQEAISEDQVASIEVNALGGDDTITVANWYTDGVFLPSLIWGGDGNDTVSGGHGSDLIEGGAGDDFLWGAMGNDTLSGEAGSDTLDGSSGHDVILGGLDDDLIDASDGDDWVEGGGGEDTMHGESGRDTLSGGDGHDRLFGGTENDILSGDANNDFLSGDAGNDTLHGGMDRDTLYGDESSIPWGGTGFDVLHGGEENDTLVGQGGDDFLSGDAGDDHISGNDGADTIYGDDASIPWGGSGWDVMWGGWGRDTMAGQGGQDVLFGEGDSDVLYGNDGHDQLWGDSNSGVGNDQLFGGWGNDTLRGGPANDTLQGEGDNDSLFGDEGHDSLVGGTGLDTLAGGGGNDTLGGGTDHDWVSGGADHDLEYGDDGNDIVGAYLDPATGAWVDDAGNDTLRGGTGNDVLGGGTGFDWVSGGFDHDVEFGDADGDIVGSYLDPVTRIWVDDPGNDTLRGGLGDDVLGGGSGYDLLLGEAGRDRLFGDGENDILFGGASAEPDTLTGGAGGDLFLPIFQKDDITDLRNEDARVNLTTTGVRFWAEPEVQLLARGMEFLMRQTGNTRLMKRANGAEFQVQRVPGLGGSILADNNTLGLIRFADLAFTSTISADTTMVHEIGHNWDDQAMGASQLGAWYSISDWRPLARGQAAPTGFLVSLDGLWCYSVSANNRFARNYGRTNPMEDWSTSWEAYYAYKSGRLSTSEADRLRIKLDFVAQFMRSLR